MLNLLWLVPVFPLAGFLALSATEGRLAEKTVAWIGAGSAGLSALLAAAIGSDFLSHPPEAFRQVLWQWMAVDGFTADFAFYLDTLSLNMLFVVAGIGFLIHVYAAAYMAGDPGYSRFFAYMNLFVFAMLVLVLADNLVLLYLGWEGVGLCSYLLIGFWHQQPENGYAARKAFIVTRVGDTAFALGLFLLFTQLGTLDIQAAMANAKLDWPVGSEFAVLAALLLLGGAVGKSAQFPLHVWLPDAMAGPTPVSALIHAATMVTAGVYLIARTHVLFELAPPVQTLVAAIGALTLLMAGCSALAQSDIKRILAYSTISQIGYLFLGLGVGAWSAAIFHLMTHAFFKALLFLAAGAVILSLHHEQDIFNMGGLRKRLPVAFWAFLIGSAALAAVPFTSGFYSKHEILLAAFGDGVIGPWFWAAGVGGAFLTALYSSRLILVVFFGPDRTQAKESLPLGMAVPLLILACLSILGGLLEMPLSPVFPGMETHAPGISVSVLTTVLPLLGIPVGILFYGTRRYSAERLLQSRGGFLVYRFWLKGWMLDWVYDSFLVGPYLYLARLNKADVLDWPYRAVVTVLRHGHGLLALTQTGRLRWYAAGMVCGLVLILGLGVWA